MSNIKFYITKENKNNFIASNGDLKKEGYVLPMLPLKNMFPFMKL